MHLVPDGQIRRKHRLDQRPVLWPLPRWQVSGSVSFPPHNPFCASQGCERVVLAVPLSPPPPPTPAGSGLTQERRRRRAPALAAQVTSVLQDPRRPPPPHALPDSLQLLAQALVPRCVVFALPRLAPLFLCPPSSDVCCCCCFCCCCCYAQCAVGQYSSAVASDTCSPCAAGRYGDAVALTVSSCTGVCSAGFFCPAGSSSPTGNVCPAGQYSGSGAASCSSCMSRQSTHTH
jgi:hypothetical protein